MLVKLKVLEGSSKGKELPVTGPEFIIGRGETCQHGQQNRLAHARARKNTHPLSTAAGKEGIYRPDTQIQFAANPPI